MRAFTQVVYGIIDVALLSALHIGTGKDSKDQISDIAVDSDGAYILPASAIAGVSLHYIRGLEDDMADAALSLMGNPLNPRAGARLESKVYFYDAHCENVQIEQRTGVGMDHKRGTAMNGRLFKNLYLSPGMTAQIRLQIFAADQDEVETAEWLITRIAQGYHTGRIAMGARTSSGAGRFRVTGVQTLTLDLTTDEGLDQYLSGVESCYERAQADGQAMDIATLSQNTTDHIDRYVLHAYCPQGLIVKSGEKYPRMKGEQADNVTVNMFYTMPQELDADTEPELHYFIPGTAVKGILRTYAERVYSVLHMDETELDYLFGPDPDSDAPKRKSCINTFDTDLPNVRVKSHNRIKIDRLLGSVMDGGKMEEELLYITETPFELQIMIDNGLLESLEDDHDAPAPDVLRQHAEAILFLAMRDLGTGRVTLGSGSSIGHGRLQGEDLIVNDATFPISGEEIACGDREDRITALLESLQGGAQ